MSKRTFHLLSDMFPDPAGMDLGLAMWLDTANTIIHATRPVERLAQDAVKDEEKSEQSPVMFGKQEVSACQSIEHATIHASSYTQLGPLQFPAATLPCLHHDQVPPKHAF